VLSLLGTLMKSKSSSKPLLFKFLRFSIESKSKRDKVARLEIASKTALVVLITKKGERLLPS